MKITPIPGMSDRPLRSAATITGGLLVAAALAGPADAQEPRRESAERECACSRGLSVRAAPWMNSGERRARLGMMLGAVTEASGRSGIELEDVPEGTPAWRAGLRAGDVVVAVDGTALVGDPVGDLMDRMEGVEPGDTVTVTYVRAGDERSAAVVAEASSAFRFFGDRGTLRLRPGRAPAAPAVPRGPVMRGGTSRWLEPLRRDGLGLTAVNPDLGRYFGTDRGVLVTRIDEDSTLGLQPGDVILEIDGREVRDPRHARAILGSYRQDEEIRLGIVREERNMDVTGRLGS